MPCLDGNEWSSFGSRTPWAEFPSDTHETDIHEAMLCGIARALIKYTGSELAWEAIVNLVDYEQTGVSKEQFMNWWKDHKLRDNEKCR